jgi:hypothetical protein
MIGLQIVFINYSILNDIHDHILAFATWLTPGFNNPATTEAYTL